MTNEKKYYQAVKYLESIFNLPQPDRVLDKASRDFSLRRMKFFLKRLGNPQLGLKYIHVGGTSGKGSIATFTASILTSAGYRTGLYTSPHQTTTIERIKVGNLLISPLEFADIMDQLKPEIDYLYTKTEYGRPSYFEILAAIAFVYFKKQRCDWVVLEVGLGGKNDTTNVIKDTAYTVINLIGFDHTEILGKTLSKITAEKAAIIKPKCSFFTTDQNHPRVIKLLKQACLENRARFNLVGLPEKPYRLKLFGKHQQRNAEIAARVCQEIGVNKKIIRIGLSRATMACRLETIRKKPLIIMDGAHNPSKMKSIGEIVKNLTYQKLYLIIALSKGKDVVKTMDKIKNYADYVFLTRYQSCLKKCNSPLEIAKKVKFKVPHKIFLDPVMAFSEAQKRASANDLILVTGSFYLAGELRQIFRPESRILKERKI